ncbi:MAG: hypothetical protein HOP32_03405 [Nitrospira sp.]|nr:hypothetical protein [Nitrospira sp.]
MPSSLLIALLISNPRTRRFRSRLSIVDQLNLFEFCSVATMDAAPSDLAMGQLLVEVRRKFAFVQSQLSDL